MKEEYITKDYLEKILDEKFDKFAIMLHGEFRRIDERFEKIDERFERIDARFDSMDSRFDRIEFGVLGNHERRIENLEDSSRIIKTKLSVA